jgi:membrane protein implicated in regulation of membrane protease activity
MTAHAPCTVLTCNDVDVTEPPASPPAAPGELRHARYLWLWPLAGLLVCTLAGVVFGPGGTLLAAVVGVCAAVLYLDQGILSARWQLGVIVVALVAVAALVVAHARDVSLLRDSPAGAEPRGARGEGHAPLSARDIVTGRAGRSDLRGEVLDGWPLDRAVLYDRDLSGAALVGTRLRDADLRDAELRGADLRKADLSGACLDRADLTGAVLDEARISGAHLAGATLPPYAAHEWKALTSSPCPRP